MARPRAEIDKTEFEKLCGLQCTKQEVCCWFDVTDKTLERWCKDTYHNGFSDVFREKRGLGLISLRRYQMRLAEKNAAMAIFLGKNYLGQTDKQEITTPRNGQLEELIQGLREPVYDLHAETTGIDGIMEDEQAQTP